MNKYEFHCGEPDLAMAYFSLYSATRKLRLLW